MTFSAGLAGGAPQLLMAGPASLMDFSLLPDFDEVRKYFGLTAAYGISRDDGFYVEVKLLEPQGSR